MPIANNCARGWPPKSLPYWTHASSRRAKPTNSQVKLDRFTIDRLMSILARLGQHVDVTVNVHPPAAASARFMRRCNDALKEEFLF